VLVCLAELGRPLGNLAIGLLISIHAVGLTCVLEPWFADAPFRTRLRLSLGLLIAVGLVVYLPARNLIEARWFAPVRIYDRVIVVAKFKTPHVNRGEWLAYSLLEGGTHDAY